MDYIACQAPPSVGLSRQEYWSGLPFTPLGDLPDLGIVLVSPASPALIGRRSLLPLSHLGSLTIFSTHPTKDFLSIFFFFFFLFLTF